MEYEIIRYGKITQGPEYGKLLIEYLDQSQRHYLIFVKGVEVLSLLSRFNVISDADKDIECYIAKGNETKSNMWAVFYEYIGEDFCLERIINFDPDIADLAITDFKEQLKVDYVNGEINHD